MNKKAKLMLIALSAIVAAGLVIQGYFRVPDAKSETGDDANPNAASGDDHGGGAAIIRLDGNLAKDYGLTIGRAERRVLADTVRAPAEVRLNAYKTAKITNRIPAQIVRREVRLGDVVRKGDVTVTLSSVELARAEADLIVAYTEWKRVRTLGREVVSERRFVEGRSTFERDRAIVLAYGMTAAQVEELIAGEGSRKADGNFNLLAPGHGTIITDDFVEGEYVEAGRVLFTISDLSTLWVEAQFAPADARRIKIGDTAEITSGGETFTGKVARFHEILDEVTRTRGVRVEVANGDRRLRAGQFVDVVIPVSKQRQVLAIPEAAIALIDGTPTVFGRVRGGLRPRPVVLGQTRQGWTEVLSGLSPDDEIALSGVFVLKSLILKDRTGEGGGH